MSNKFKMCNKKIKNNWDQKAYDWYLQVGKDGDSNRILNSDPVLWQFAGNVSGLKIIDAGCGSGYLTQKLYDLGANVVGIDFSEKMIEIAKNKSPDIEFLVDSCTELSSFDDNSFDMIISNYVLMDIHDLQKTLSNFNRVLKDGGEAILIFSHPCFPQENSSFSLEKQTFEYQWKFNYFDVKKCIAPPWAHFTSEFIWFHRPLSFYWKSFITAGFNVNDFEEPHLTEERYHLAPNKREIINNKTRPFSVAFKLKKIKEVDHDIFS